MMAEKSEEYSIFPTCMHCSYILVHVLWRTGVC